MLPRSSRVGSRLRLRKSHSGDPDESSRRGATLYVSAALGLRAQSTENSQSIASIVK